RERRCLAEAIYYEARSETLAGQMAVAEVVINRSRHRAYPNSICGVVYQGSERRTGCQFTFT
ncbi:MAG TPA: cell wall hydrolase, partial [Oceanicaulis sp.]|nr:cell wall hydrolase [Oceanicaulis sp.]